MINKKNIWFLTLFSLVLVLSVYYVTMPNDILLDINKPVNATTTDVQEIGENATLVALRVDKEEKVLEELENLNSILTDASKTVEEKNAAYDKMKNINDIKVEEERIEKKLSDTFNLTSVVSIDADTIKVVALSNQNDTTLANNVMRTIQNDFENKMYISVKFENN